MKAAIHSKEAERLAALRSFGILDTPKESDFDDIVRVVSEICQTPISVVNLIDNGRQWFKAEVGLGIRETPIDSSLCAHAILQPGLMVVPDTRLDNRFIDNPLVTGDPKLRFYAGALLETADGLPVGTVCVLDYKPRNLTETQKSLLKVMAAQVMKMLELRKLVAVERDGRLKAELLANENAILAREGDHRVMNSLQLVQSVLSMQIRNAETAEIKVQLESARNRVLAIASVHRDLHMSGSLENVEIGSFLRRICDGLKDTAPAQITNVTFLADEAMMPSDLASTMGLIVAELVTNSFKHAYRSDEVGSVSIKFILEANSGWLLEVADNGQGLPSQLDVTSSKGVGMRVVNALVRRLGAMLLVETRSGQTAFQVRFISSEIAKIN